MSQLLEIRDLSVVYPGRGRRKDKVALEGVSVKVGAGETLGLVGESGSGKSTLGGCVLGLVRPAHGQVVFDGRDVARLSGRDRRALSTQIQAVFQDPYSSFNPHRTIEQTVGETLTNLPTQSRPERRARIVAMLERVGLDQSALGKFPAQFSGGQRQRIAIARALLPEPRLVVCDESVSALDLSVQAQVLNLLLELQRERGVAYLFITHDLAVVRHMSNRIAVLEHGHLVEEGDARQVTEHPTQPYTRRLINASPQADPDVQDARRATRRAIPLLQRESFTEADDPGIEILHALETQAVTEALARPGVPATALDRALAQFAENPDDLTRLVGLRAAIPELAARTSAAMTPDLVLRRVDEARKDLCGALADSGRAMEFAARCQELSAAIKGGERERALALVGSIDDKQTRTTQTEVGQR
jgi:ABC-type oligopeptide transport system ATPase subunit